MKKVCKPLLILFALLALACSNDEDDNNSEVIFAGEWTGTFSGGDSGIWTAVIGNDGTVTGDAFSNSAQQSLPLSGTIDTKGDFRATVGTAQNGATFEGTFASDTSSGTWENAADQISGTWQGSRN